MEVGSIIHALINVFTPLNFFAALFGTLIGLIIGILPGLGTVMAVALLTPLTFGMKAQSALIMLAAIYGGGVAGGSVAAILLRTPGTAGAAATVLDGYEMAVRGEGSKAIGTSMISSFLGGVFGALVLLILGPPLSKISILFGPVEYFWFAIFGLTAMAGISTQSTLKGLMMGIFGLFLGTVGMDPITGVCRYTFDSMQLVSGLSLLPVLIGFFSVSQVFMLLDKATLEGKVHSVKSIRDTLPSMTQLLRMKYLYLKSAVIGTVIGILPGAGSEISSFIAYREAKRGSKTPEKFGTGTMEGVAAPECANNATVPASLIPLLTLGIPGSPTAAVMFGALLIHNLTPGRTLFTEQAETTYTLIFGIILASALMAIMGILIAKWASKIVLCPNEILGPLILNLCFVGAFAAAHNLFDVYVAFGFGIIGYVLRKVGFDGAPAVLGFVLGPIAERGLRQALILGRGDLTYLFASPISKVLILLALLSLCAPYISLMIKKNKAGAKF